MGFIFNRKKKVSKDGTKVDVISYGDEERREWTPPAQAGVYLDEIQAHIDKIYPCKEKEPYVYHEIVSDIVHIDVNVIPPEGERDYYVLWTSGMSDLPMDLPDGSRNPKEYNRAELLMYLPGDWELGHTLPNGPEYAPLGEGTKMSGFFFLPPIPLGPAYPGVDNLICKDGTKINFLWAIPMYKEEIEFKLEEGFDAMMELFSEKQFPRVLDPKRENYR